MLALTLAASGAQAHAQLRLPSLNLPIPSRIGPLETDALRQPADRLLGNIDLPALGDLRLGQVRQLLRRHRDVLEADPRGEPVVRREILAFAPSPAGLAAAQAAGLSVLRESGLEGLGASIVLRVPEGADIAALLDLLRAADPDGAYDFNHVYTGSGAAATTAVMQDDKAARPAGKGGATSVGLVDSGVDATHAVFRETALQRWGCADVAYPSPHGTAVAALMVGQSEHFRGVAPQARLYAADVYCNSGSGGSADRISAALAWLARENVAVINMSIVGPHNQTLAKVVDAMVRRGHLLVAAVGNDGPAAPPLYPASYPGVVGVSAVDKRGRVLPEAARGPQVMFAAPGNQMVSASVGAPPYRPVRGTSYASPIVAALLAGALARPDQAGARAALAALVKQARRDDPSTVSNETGHGIVGSAYRLDPSAFR